MVRVRSFFAEKDNTEFPAVPNVTKRDDRYVAQGTATATYGNEAKRRHIFTAEASRVPGRVPIWKVHKVTIDGNVVVDEE